MTRSLSVEVGPTYISVKGCSEVSRLINQYYSRQSQEVELSTYVDEDIVLIHFPPPKGHMGRALAERFSRLRKFLQKAGYTIIPPSDYREIFNEDLALFPLTSTLVH